MKPLKSQHRIAAYLFSGWLLLSFVKVAALLPKDRAGWAFALVGLALAIQVGTLAMLSFPGQFWRWRSRRATSKLQSTIPR